MPRDRDEIDDLVDGLTVPERYRETRTEELPIVPTVPAEPVRPRTNWRAVGAVVLFVGGLMTGICGAGTMNGSDSSSAPPSSPTATVTVTTTTTQPVLAGSCRRALELMERVMTDTSTVGSAATRQMDIAHAARQAMFTKDWKALDDAMNRQKELNDELAEASIGAMQNFPELREAIRKCKNEAGI